MKIGTTFAGLLCLTVAAAPAGAATISATYDFFDSGLLPTPYDFEIAGFDPATGVLQGVTFEVLGRADSRFSINNPSLDAFTYETETYAGFNFAFGGLTLDTSGSEILSTLVAGQGSETNLAGFVLVSGSASSSDPGVLGAFTSASPLTGRSTPLLGFRCNNCRDPFEVQLDTFLEMQNQLRVTYDYAPAVAGPVPEPATWAMLLAGFGLVGGALRSRRATRTDSAAA